MLIQKVQEHLSDTDKIKNRLALSYKKFLFLILTMFKFQEELKTVLNIEKQKHVVDYRKNMVKQIFMNRSLKSNINLILLSIYWINRNF